MATANDVSQLPPESIRKGRVDEMFFVDLPDSAVRVDIRQLPLTRCDLPVESFDLPRLVVASEGFSSAEIEQAVVSAVYAAAARQESLRTEELLDTPVSTIVGRPGRAYRGTARLWARGRAVMAD